MISPYTARYTKRTLPALLTVTAVLVAMTLSLRSYAAGPARPDIHIHIKTVLASQTGKVLDPQLSALIKEMQTVFRYTSYRLLKEDRLTLRVNETRKVMLAGNRSLNVTPLRIIGSRVELELVAFKNQGQIFHTRIQLRNRSSIIVGGPAYKNGVLIFSIAGSF